MKNSGINIFLILLLIGCTTHRYTWDGYHSTLYKYYKNPAEKEKFMSDLEKIILKAEQTEKVPPGIYAEYGYILYENKKYTEATEYFQKEYDLWPESQLFMMKMIRNANMAVQKTQKMKEADE